MLWHESDNDIRRVRFEAILFSQNVFGELVILQ